MSPDETANDDAAEIASFNSIPLEEDLARRRNDPGTLWSPERRWRHYQPWLAEKGYALRARYQPDWVPSWKGKNKFYDRFEDGQDYTVRDRLRSTYLY
jgi:hypothetical protein